MVFSKAEVGLETRRDESIESNRFEGQPRGARGYHPRWWMGGGDFYLHDDIACPYSTVECLPRDTELILGDVELNFSVE